MKPRTAVCFLLILCLLGCSAAKDTQITCKELTLTLPEIYLDLSAESYAEEADFLYGRGRLIVMGLGEAKSELKTATLDGYTALVLKAHALTCSPERTGNGYRFSYDAPVGDPVYSYVTATYESSAHFWVIQCYCPAEYLETYAQEISTILDSVRLS